MFWLRLSTFLLTFHQLFLSHLSSCFHFSLFGSPTDKVQLSHLMTLLHKVSLACLLAMLQGFKSSSWTAGHSTLLPLAVSNQDTTCFQISRQLCYFLSPSYPCQFAAMIAKSREKDSGHPPRNAIPKQLKRHALFAHWHNFSFITIRQYLLPVLFTCFACSSYLVFLLLCHLTGLWT